MKKNQIYYHRSHRKLTFFWKRFTVEFLLLVPPSCLFVFFLFPVLTYKATSFIIRFIPPENAVSTLGITAKPFLFSEVYGPDLIGKYPSPLFSLFVFLAAILIVFIVSKMKIPKPIAMWVYFICLVHLVSSLFFIFLPSRFPYNLQQFSELFIKTEIIIWIFIPVVLGVSLLPLPSSIISKFIAVILALIYAIVFGLVRYVLFVYILLKFSYIFTAPLFFCFGPFIDFISIVGVYAFYLSLISRKINQDLRIWSWSY